MRVSQSFYSTVLPCDPGIEQLIVFSTSATFLFNVY